MRCPLIRMSNLYLPRSNPPGGAARRCGGLAFFIYKVNTGKSCLFGKAFRVSICRPCIIILPDPIFSAILFMVFLDKFYMGRQQCGKEFPGSGVQIPHRTAAVRVVQGTSAPKGDTHWRHPGRGMGWPVVRILAVCLRLGHSAALRNQGLPAERGSIPFVLCGNFSLGGGKPLFLLWKLDGCEIARHSVGAAYV